MQNTKKHKITAKTVFGLENLLADELKRIGASDIEILNRAVQFMGKKETIYKANLELRTALRILVPIHEFDLNNEDQLYGKTRDIDWSEYLDPDTTFAIDSTVNSRHFNHENFVALKVKDSIVDQLRDKFGKRPDIDTDDPDYRLNVHISDEHCTISLDSSGTSLHKRGYRIDQTVAPINEVLAAGMIMLTGWNGDSDLIDPMCGSGTILMEAATIAHNIAPGRNRSFGFEKWKDFEEDLWNKIKMESEKREKDFSNSILGFDESPKAISIAKKNIKNAGLGWKIILKPRAIQKIRNEHIGDDGGVVIINPPYGERIENDQINSLYKEIGDELKQVFSGYDVWIISSNKTALKNIGLRTSKRLVLHNGSLECKYHKYEMYRGSRKEKYQN